MYFIDESFWIAVSFVIFLYFLYKPIRNAILRVLDTKIQETKKDLAESEKLKTDAKLLLDEIEKEMQHFDEYKRQVMRRAEDSTSRLIAIKTKEMELMLARQRDSAINSIENEKSKAADKLRDEFTDKVIKLVRSYLIETKNNNISDSEIITNFINKKNNL